MIKICPSRLRRSTTPKINVLFRENIPPKYGTCNTKESGYHPGIYISKYPKLGLSPIFFEANSYVFNHILGLCYQEYIHRTSKNKRSDGDYGGNLKGTFYFPPFITLVVPSMCTSGYRSIIKY